MSFDFDEIIDRVGTHSSKWDTMEIEIWRVAQNRHSDVGC